MVPESVLFNTDLCIVDLVDADNRPVAPGVPSAKVLANQPNPANRSANSSVVIAADTSL